MQIVFPKQRRIDDVGLIIADASYVGAKLHLYSNDLNPNVNTVIGDLTECIYSGYAAQTLTWSDPFVDEHGLVVSSAGEKLFVQAGATPDFCYGAYLTDTAGTELLWVGRLDDAPFSFANDGDCLPLAVKMGLGIGLTERTITP